ncbi:FHA domain-containing protein [Thiothrix lacustris]|uniref:FHA domain-containing protein n=1 Tax=Thiothrix lacustris TaxID=525917 RepID=UPI00068491A6|nr:FHA domain-containing protein [Thiothrix lacustris]
MNQLIVMLEKQILKRVTLKTTSITLGRNNKSDITLPDRTISAHHARITVIRDDCFLEDLQSTNNTYVNQHIVERHLLEDGDIIGLGKYHIVFRSEQGLSAQLKRLTLHPKLMDSGYEAWLQIRDGHKAGYIIPLKEARIVLGNQTLGQILVERTPSGDYIKRENGTMNNHRTQNLSPGDLFKVEDTTFQFCLKESNTHDKQHSPHE